jgi:hypothetical protein
VKDVLKLVGAIAIVAGATLLGLPFLVIAIGALLIVAAAAAK